MRFLKIFSVALLACGAAVAQTTPSAPVSFDKAAMDVTANACQDFYQYACGGWRTSHPIPADKARYGRFDELREYNLYLLHSILEDAAKPGKHTANEKKVGDFYAACMDEKAVDAKGIQPIEPWLKKVAAITTKQQVLDVVAEMQSKGLRPVFGFGAGPDLHNSALNIAQVDQGGLTLADRDYYLKQDAKMVEVRGKYVEHIQKMLTLAGESADQSAKDAATILALETKIADASMDRVARRDPKNRDHKMTVAELGKQAPQIDFPRYFKLVGAEKFDSLNVGNPEFFQKLSGLLASEPVDTWKTYLRWRVVKGSAPLLSKSFVDENFEFQGKYLSGQKELEARWKRCTSLTDNSLGEALGPIYVAKAFPKEAKQRMDVLVAAVEQSMSGDIQSLDWMSPDTKKAANAKLEKVTNKIGYPAKWKDYSKVIIKRDDLVGNARAASIFEIKRDLAKLGNPVDRAEWNMTPPTVNAYYSSSENNINFPAGILQPPFFSAKVDESVNYGGIGVVIGHELTHGFDDQGRKFDGDGNFTNWWGPTDGPEFEKRAGCVADEYSSFVSVKDDKGEVHLNGKLTLGENTADNGGLKLAFMSMTKQLGDKIDQPIDGFTPAQRFFIGFAQVWCENVTPQRARELALTDPHSPGKFRVIGTVQNSP
ncbi:MAG TPA: M13 family metallopeptidase, partial [Candidatus Saccharimonadales bacterium]|nr:M13 family metallopeptidase [Candidatus Saccharimonadales bacterium]